MVKVVVSKSKILEHLKKVGDKALVHVNKSGEITDNKVDIICCAYNGMRHFGKFLDLATYEDTNDHEFDITKWKTVEVKIKWIK